MKRRLLMLCICVLLTVLVFPASAQNDGELTDAVTARLKRAQVATVQQWIDGELSTTAGQGSEWIVAELAKNGQYDFSAYRTALEAYLDSTTVSSAVSRQKYALTLSMIGGDEAYVESVIDTTIGQQGIMSEVYGLRLLSVDDTAATETVSQTIDRLLSMQLSDGGWAVTGTVSDVDVTAMTLQALSPYADDPAVQTSIEKALSLLSVRQLDNGDFASYGVPNAESTAQVIAALSSLGIDAAADLRFLKNGCSPLDGLARYVVGDGMYRHCDGRDADMMASDQALCALMAYTRLNQPSAWAALSSLCVVTDTGSVPTSPALLKTSDAGDYKLPVCIGVGVTAVGLSLWLVLIRRRSARNAIVIGAAAVVVMFGVWCVDIQSSDAYYGAPTTPKTNVIGKVTVSVRCDTIPDKSAAHVPDDGVVLETVTVPIADGDTVYSVLLDVAQTHRLVIDHSGGYIRGVAGIAEMDFGDLSGWLYHVNGEEPSVGCDQYMLSDGDTVEWLYTCRMGHDLS